MCQDLLNNNTVLQLNDDKKLKTNRVKRKAKSGFTLMELMISVLFFAVISAGVSLPLSNSVYLNVDNKNINTAKTLAKSYLRDLQNSWKLQTDFDQGLLIEVDEIYNNNAVYGVNVSTESLELDENDNVLVRRVRVVYTDSNNQILCDIYYDYNRPGNV